MNGNKHLIHQVDFGTPYSLIIVGCVLAMLLMISGCDKRQERERISLETKNWASTVKAAPETGEGKEALLALRRTLNGNWRFGSTKACYAIREAELGDLAYGMVPDLIKAADCDDPYIEDAAVQALGSIGPAAASSVELLVKKTKAGVEATSVKSVSCYAARALGDIGEPALPAIDILKSAAASPDDFLASEAKEALEKLRRLPKN